MKKPALRLGSYTHAISSSKVEEPSTCVNTSCDPGFTVTEFGYVDVIVTQIVLECGVPSDGKVDGDPTENVPAQIADASGSDKKPLSTTDRPLRLCGRIDDRAYIMACTVQGSAIRMTSARKVNRKEVAACEHNALQD